MIAWSFWDTKWNNQIGNQMFVRRRKWYRRCAQVHKIELSTEHHLDSKSINENASNRNDEQCCSSVSLIFINIVIILSTFIVHLISAYLVYFKLFQIKQ